MNINQLTSHLAWILGDRSPRLKKQIEALEVKMKEVCYDLPQAVIPTHSIELNPRQINLSDLSWGDDYEVSGCFTVQVDDKELRKFLKIDEYEWATESERDDIIDALDDHESTCRDNEQRCLKNDHTDRAQYWDDLGDAINDLIRDIKRAEIEYDEVMWNTVWRPYNDNVDAAIARQCRLAVVTLLKGDDEGDSYLALTGCGMDLRPLRIAYCALKYGQVDHDEVSYFCKDINFTSYVMGPSLWQAVTEKLGITKLMKQRLAKETKEQDKNSRAQERWRKQTDARRARNEKQRQAVARKLLAVQERIADFPGEDLGVLLRVVDGWLDGLLEESVPHAKRFQELLRTYMALQGNTGPITPWRDVLEDAGVPSKAPEPPVAPVAGVGGEQAPPATPSDPAASTPSDEPGEGFPVHGDTEPPEPT